MKLLILGRSYPEVETGMVGIFEYEQAQAVSNLSENKISILYSFCDNRSIFRLRRINSILKNDSSIVTYGKYFPIGGVPNRIFDKIKSKLSVNILRKAIIKLGKPDVIHIHFPIITLTEEIWEYLVSLGSKIVITEHYSRVQNKELTVQQIELLRKIAKRADKFLCVNEFLPKSIEELTGVQRDFIIVPNVVAPIFSREKETKNDVYRFISIGRLVKDKKFDLVIEAFVKKFKDVTNVELIIVGGGEEYTNLKKQIVSLNMEHKIRLTGFLKREETAQILASSNSYVTASSFETFGVPLVEAMSCGKPVISADTSPLKQYISEERGFLFKVDNLESLASAMEKMYEQRFINKSYEIAEFAKMNFSERAIAEKLFSIYSSCINKEVNKE
ncbi:glycosyltransferase family 4 protein [Cytobacillus horneckiae]|uniref:Glycosyltransferase family 4 protein n=1 Tax=Cytobacillus horneckiae TaxID=549687 RepID=A0A2N0ZFT0_9BACI|nr:glycosyltransferase family 4 protein [Cytobacillus horneckiae]MEC1154373.1 glycosyltransferase family 4 protein [Cytobacillus horneckiae]MED2937708.1 glycosyltransferase family 4 protein [Cytobacillus horneckiae]PKG28357.1 glycosyltransferase family 4 protein [Cytobacillus horneckiae]